MTAPDPGRTAQPNADPAGDAPLECLECGLKTRAEVVKAAFWTDRGLVVIEDIPARVCQGCGEQFYDEPTAGRIEKRLADPAAEPERHLVVPVFSLSAESRSR